MKKLISLAILWLTVTTSIFAQNNIATLAEKIYFPYFELINVKTNYQYSTTRLLKDYLAENKRYELVIPAKPDSIYGIETKETTMANATRLGCKYYALGSINKVGEVGIINIAMYNTADGSIVWADRLKAASSDDLEPIMQKIADNLGTQNNASTDGSIYGVTDYDQKRLKKQNSNNAFAIGIGSYIPTGPALNENFAGFNIGFVHDTRLMFLEGHFIASFTQNGNSMLSGSIEAYKPLFNEKNNSPYFGGGFGLGGFTGSRETTNITSFYRNNNGDTVYYNSGNSYRTSNHGYGLHSIVGIGYIFGRKSSTQLRISTNLNTALYKLENGNIPVGVATKIELLF